MAYDEGLAARIQEYFYGNPDVIEKKMFGGIAFMVSGHMCCGIINDMLMARVGPLKYEDYLSEKHAQKMDFTGKPSKGMLYIAPEGLESDEELGEWIERCLAFVLALPPKEP